MYSHPSLLTPTPYSPPLPSFTPTPHSPPLPPHPSRFLSLTVSTAKGAPELIQLLEMHSYLAPLQKGKVCVCACVCATMTGTTYCHGHPTPLWSCVSPAMVIPPPCGHVCPLPWSSHPPVVVCVPCHGRPTPLWSCVYSACH